MKETLIQYREEEEGEVGGALYQHKFRGWINREECFERARKCFEAVMHNTYKHALTHIHTVTESCRRVYYNNYE